MRLLLLAFALLPLFAFAAAPLPGTDIWLVDLDGTAALTASNPRNLTRRPGYENQPHFVGSDAFLFTSSTAGEQTDAWRYDLRGRALPLRITPESEYSPTSAPENRVSVVRVDANGVQQLWWLAPDEEEYELLFPLLEGIGYHAWVDDDRVALFMVREPSELHIANRRTGEVMVLAKDIGRSLQRVPGEATRLAFVEAGTDGARWIKQYDFHDRHLTALAPLPERGEDFIFMPDGRLLIASGRALLVWQDGEWREFARFDELPGEITRIAVSRDMRRLAMVVAEGE